MEGFVKGSIKFYDEEKQILFPPSYDEFHFRLGQTLGLTEDLLKGVNVSYLDDLKNNVGIKNQNDYQQFLEFAKKLDGKGQINIQIAEESNNNVKQSSDPILSSVDINNAENINIIGENKSSIFSRVLNEGESSNENKNVESKEKLPSETMHNVNKIGNENKNISNNINRNENVLINNNNNINNINNFNNDINQFKNINNNSNQINNQINNQNNNNINNNQINNNNQMNNMYYQPNPQTIAFNVACKFCRRNPLYQVLYYCKECNAIFCSSCESQIGITHEHAYFKIQNQKQFYYFNFGKLPTMDQFMNDFGKTMENAYDKVVDFFGGKKNNNNNRNNINNVNNFNNVNNVNNQRVMQPQRPLSLVEQARMMYDLSKVSDKQIEDALKKSGNNIDEAVILLFNQ